MSRWLLICSTFLPICATALDWTAQVSQQGAWQANPYQLTPPEPALLADTKVASTLTLGQWRLQAQHLQRQPQRYSRQKTDLSLSYQQRNHSWRWIQTIAWQRQTRLNVDRNGLAQTDWVDGQAIDVSERYNRQSVQLDSQLSHRLSAASLVELTLDWQRYFYEQQYPHLDNANFESIEIGLNIQTKLDAWQLGGQFAVENRHYFHRPASDWQQTSASLALGYRLAPSWQWRSMVSGEYRDRKHRIDHRRQWMLSNQLRWQTSPRQVLTAGWEISQPQEHSYFGWQGTVGQAFSASVEHQLGRFVNAHWQLEVAAGLADDRLDFPKQAFAERYVAIELTGQWPLR